MPTRQALGKIVNEQQLQQVMLQIEKITKKPDYYQLLFYFGAWAGLRSSEACRVNLKDLDFLDKTILLREQKNKDSFQRHPLPDCLVDLVKDYVIKYEKEIKLHDGFLFWSGRNATKHLTVGGVEDFVKILQKRLVFNEVYKVSSRGHRLQTFSFHTLRHYYCTTIYERSRSFLDTMRLGRHKSHSSALRYQHQSLSERREVVSRVFDDESLRQDVSDLKELLSDSNLSVLVEAIKKSRV